MIRLLGTITEDRRREVSEDLRRGSVLGRDYVLMVVLSCAIATFGLALNSGAVIIGAMLISPLMTPILGVALGLVHGEPRSVVRALATLALGMLLAVGLSTVLGQLVVPFGIDLVDQLPAEIVARTKPTLFDLAVALAGGAAGSYALAQPRLSATLPGVAIATALMPPVCVVGLGLALGRPDVAMGALLLFLANFVAIVFASSLVFLSVGFAPAAARRLSNMALLITGALLLLVAAPLGAFMTRIILDAQETNLIRTSLEEQLAAVTDSSLVGFERDSTGDQQNIVATIRSPRSLTYAEAVGMQREVAVRLQKPVALKVLLIPLTRLDPLVPATLTPTPAAGAAPLPTATPAPTATPVPTTEPPRTATPTPPPTRVPSPSPLPTLSPTPTPEATPSPAPPAYAVVGATAGQGANVHRGPGLSDILAAVPEGTIVQLTGTTLESDGLMWREAILPDGRVGWLTDRYLIPYATYRAP